MLLLWLLRLSEALTSRLSLYTTLTMQPCMQFTKAREGTAKSRNNECAGNVCASLEALYLFADSSTHMWTTFARQLVHVTLHTVC
jgi:hypothetical protein